MKKKEIINTVEVSKENHEILKEDLFKRAKKGSLILAGEKTCMEFKGVNEKGRVWSFS